MVDDRIVAFQRLRLDVSAYASEIDLGNVVCLPSATRRRHSNRVLWPKAELIFTLRMVAGHTIKLHREKLAAGTGLGEGIIPRHFIAVTYFCFVFQKLNYTVSVDDILKLVFFHLIEKQGA